MFKFCQRFASSPEASSGHTKNQQHKSVYKDLKIRIPSQNMTVNLLKSTNNNREIILKNLPAWWAHSHRAQLASLASLSAPRARDLIVALRARSCALRIHLSLFLII